MLSALNMTEMSQIMAQVPDPQIVAQAPDPQDQDQTINSQGKTPSEVAGYPDLGNGLGPKQA